MGLVSYSDSEGSDTEEAPKQSNFTASKNTPTTSAKPSFQKVVDRSNPHKIRVSLSTPAATDTETAKKADTFAESDRPAKRAKTGSAFSGFNSFLPAPKNPPKVGSGNANGAKGSVLSGSRSGGIGRGVSLKTGATPAFSRELPPEEPAFDEVEDDHSNGFEHSAYDGGFSNGISSTQVAEVPVVQEELKLVGKPMMFKPLSVARKPAKKKAATSTPVMAALTTAEQSGPASATSTTEPSGEPATTVNELPKPPPAKKSLFSSYTEDSLPPPVAEDDPIPEEHFTYGSSETTHSTPQQQYQPTNPSTGQAPDLASLADNLGLTAAQRRQLFGRGGITKDARVANFSLATEYSNNKKFIETDANAVPVHNPVRAIAPGKHSLQQLVSAAASQRDALEESFATGRRNKKDAGSRYGW